MSHWITNHGLTGENPGAWAPRNDPLSAAHVPTKTQPMYVAGTNDAFWKILCTRSAGRDWMADARFPPTRTASPIAASSSR